MKSKNIKFEIPQSTNTINFLDVCITLNQQTLSTILFSKPKELTSTLTQNLFTLDIWSEISQSHNSYVSARFALMHLITLRKVMSIYGNAWKVFLRFCQKFSKTKNMKSKNIKFEIPQSTNTINFLDVCITLNQQTLSTILFSKPKELTSTLTQNLFTLDKWSEISQSHNSYVSALMHLITLRKVMSI